MRWIPAAVPLLAALTCTIADGIASGKYTVKNLKFKEGDEFRMSLATNTADRIAPLPGEDRVNPADSGSQKPGTFYMRKRYGHESPNPEDEYNVVYAGQAHPAKCYRDLMHFRVRHPFRKRLEMRYFSERFHDWNGDIKEVYYQDSLVLSRTANLFFHPTGTYDSLEAAERVDPPSGCVEFHSTPEGATVKFGGRTLGVTPLYLSGVSMDRPTFFLSMEGYQTLPMVPVAIPESTLRYDADSLIRVPVIASKRPDLKRLMETTPKTHRGYSSIRSILSGYLKTLEMQRDSVAAKFNRHYPEFPKKGLNPDERNRRRPAYDAGRKRDSSLLLEPFRAALADFDTLQNAQRTPFDTLDKAQAAFECRCLTHSIPAAGIKLDPYYEEQGYRTFTWKANEQNFQFAFRGRLEMSSAESKAFDNRKHSAVIQFDYWNIPKYDSIRNDYLFFGLQDFRIKLDTLLKVRTYTGFEPDTNLFKPADSSQLARKIARCQNPDIKQKSRKALYSLVSGGVAFVAAAVGGLVYYVLEKEKKVVTYPVPLGDDD